MESFLYPTNEKFSEGVVRPMYNLLSSVSSQQKFEVTDIKARGACVTALGQTVLQLLDQGYSSVTAQFYLENSKKINPRDMRECQPKDLKRREPQPFGSSFYVFSTPWACPM